MAFLPQFRLCHLDLRHAVSFHLNLSCTFMEKNLICKIQKKTKKNPTDCFLGALLPKETKPR